MSQLLISYEIVYMKLCRFYHDDKNVLWRNRELLCEWQGVMEGRDYKVKKKQGQRQDC